jgi:hypothetical protein
MYSTYPFGFNGGLAVRQLPVAPAHPRRVFYVGNNSTVLQGEKSASDTANKGGFLDPFLTLDGAIGQCVSGDVIYVRPGYTQSMTAADAVDVDVAGVTIIGLGEGTSRPKFTYDNSAGEFVIGAANVRIENLWFVPSVTGITHAIDVEAAATDCQIINCDFSGAEAAGTDEFNAAITAVAGSLRGTIQGCYFNSGAAGAIYAISLGTPTDWKIIGNTILGDYSTACIGTITAAGAGVNLMLDNIVINGLPGDVNAVACFTQSSAGTWVVGRNLFAGDVATFILLFTNYTSTINLGNKYTDDTSMAATATDISATIVVSADA